MRQKARELDRLVLLLTVDKRENSGKTPAMPNKRDGSKAFAGGYIPKALKRKFKAMADKEADGDTVKMLCKLIEEADRRRNARKPKTQKDCR